MASSRVSKPANTNREWKASTMREIITEIEIAAPPERVWAILTDLPAFPSWNPFIRSIAGRLIKGDRIDVLISPPGQKAMRFRPVLLAVISSSELRWRGSLGFRGLFDGEHSFQLRSLSANRTQLLQRERFSGLLVPLIMRGEMLIATRRGFTAMNEALKSKAEAS
jgi:hypothetical protein